VKPADIRDKQQHVCSENAILPIKHQFRKLCFYYAPGKLTASLLIRANYTIIIMSLQRIEITTTGGRHVCHLLYADAALSTATSGGLPVLV